MDNQLAFLTEAQVQDHPAAFFTDSIEVCAVAGTSHALYRDVRLSGNRVRGSWARRPSRRARGVSPESGSREAGT